MHVLAELAKILGNIMLRPGRAAAFKAAAKAAKEKKAKCHTSDRKGVARWVLAEAALF